MVWIKEGLKQIKDIEVGEQVLAWDPILNQPVIETVTGRSSRVTDDVYKLTLADAAGKQTTTTVTGNHPYLLAAHDNQPASALALAANDNTAPGAILYKEPGGAWKIVRNLKAGDHIRTALNGALVDGKLIQGPGNDRLTVIAVELDRSPRRVYNLTVSNLHSFAVGELGEWTHNSVPPWIPPGWNQDSGKNDNHTRWKDPKNPKGNWVRFNKVGNYFKIFLNGCARDKNGNQVDGKSNDAHIPADQIISMPTPK
jgi:hypothetical protein